MRPQGNYEGKLLLVMLLCELVDFCLGWRSDAFRRRDITGKRDASRCERRRDHAQR
jgi:hypothetical protein